MDASSNDRPQQPDVLEEIARVFSHLDREIWIVTSAHDQRRGGLVATWVSQASIDEQNPQAAIALAPNHFTAELVSRSGTFGLHLLRREQTALAWNFALDSGRTRDKLEHLSVSQGSDGVPRIDDCLGWLICRVTETFKLPDRWYFWAAVVDGRIVQEGEVLRQSDFLASGTPQQLARLGQNLQHDIEIGRRLRHRS